MGCAADVNAPGQLRLAWTRPIWYILTKHMRPETMNPAQARKLFKAGASARSVMLDAGIRQSELAKWVGLPQSRIGDILAGRRVGGPAGRGMAHTIYDQIAFQLGISMTDIPEARPYVDGK